MPIDQISVLFVYYLWANNSGDFEIILLNFIYKTIYNGVPNIVPAYEFGLTILAKPKSPILKIPF